METNCLSKDALAAEGHDRLALSAFVRAGSVKQPSLATPNSAVCPAPYPLYHIDVDLHNGSHPSAPVRNLDGGVSDSDTAAVSPSPTLNHEHLVKLGLWETICNIFCTTVILILTFISTLLSLGVPYWYYRYYRHHSPSKLLSSAEQEKIESGFPSPDPEKWDKVLKRFTSQWKAFFAISAGTLPAVFPMLAIYPDPKCSWASLLAALSLFSGVASMIMTKLFLLFLELLGEEAMMLGWHRASRSKWARPSTQRFWLFVSLPTIWLLSQVIALTATIMLAVWEQVTISPSASVCLESRLQLFRIFVLFSLAMAIVHLAFFASVVSTLRPRT
ncbi:hypothetical protein D9756_000072 [Leucocoprinus leucothites]|uniref:Transmembrane protein n=1 Tax=Leucocoprinus leucothites TaxID=201217 RepID=A0A8H5GE26_9AGAR|nr:hypothetical protein D9756_000072 [Leucoagaricus leucothites]